MSTALTYTPEAVEAGVRDYIAWHAHYAAEVNAHPFFDSEQGDGYSVEVKVPARLKDRHANLKEEVNELLPEGYLLNWSWT